MRLLVMHHLKGTILLLGVSLPIQNKQPLPSAVCEQKRPRLSVVQSHNGRNKHPEWLGVSYRVGAEPDLEE